jgi:hypothetical protein
MIEQEHRRPSYAEKQTLQVVIHTCGNRIEGNLHVSYGHRALDALNDPDPFLAITSARIYDLEGLPIIEREFIAVSKREIVFLYENTDQPLAGSEDLNGRS